jgi:hypothetical protein
MTVITKAVRSNVTAPPFFDKKSFFLPLPLALLSIHPIIKALIMA